MEHPLLIHVARALLYAEPTAQAHAQILSASFKTKPHTQSLNRLAARTALWTAVCPLPRMRAFERKLHQDPILQRFIARQGLQPTPLTPQPARMRPFPAAGTQLALTTTRDLADWLRLDPEQLLWFADLQDLNASTTIPLLSHYTTRLLARPYGAIRLLEVPKQRLRSMQRQILTEILAPITLHPAVHGFRKGRSILTFAEPHVARQAVLRVDLQNFFPTLSGPRVQALFRTLGYPERVADLLGGLCTTSTPRRTWRNTGLELSPDELQRARLLYTRPHLPQGAPTSPAISNLCAFRLDSRISALAKAAGATYTRYADDLAFSGDEPFARKADRFAHHVFAIILDEGFKPHYRKTRLMRPAVRQHLAGLTLNVHPNLPRRELDRLEATLTNCVRHGPATQNHDAHSDFKRHLEGKVAHATMVNPTRTTKLCSLLAQIQWPDASVNGLHAPKTNQATRRA